MIDTDDLRWECFQDGNGPRVFRLTHIPTGALILGKEIWSESEQSTRREKERLQELLELELKSKGLRYK